MKDEEWRMKNEEWRMKNEEECMYNYIKVYNMRDPYISLMGVLSFSLSNTLWTQILDMQQKNFFSGLANIRYVQRYTS